MGIPAYEPFCIQFGAPTPRTGTPSPAPKETHNGDLEMQLADDSMDSHTGEQLTSTRCPTMNAGGSSHLLAAQP